MNGIFISPKDEDVFNSPLRRRIFDSNSNQWKIHFSGVVSFTGANQTKVVPHGLGYTPAFIAFEKQSANAYYNWAPVNDFVDSEKISLLGQTGDVRSYIVFKDFGR